jgi:hypothetical protein
MANSPSAWTRLSGLNVSQVSPPRRHPIRCSREARPLASAGFSLGPRPPSTGTALLLAGAEPWNRPKGYDV